MMAFFLYYIKDRLFEFCMMPKILSNFNKGKFLSKRKNFIIKPLKPKAEHPY